MNGSVYCLGFRDGTEVDLTGSAALPQNTEVCASAVYNISQQWVKMYQNGILVASNKITFKLSDIPDVNNWIGRSQFKDPYLNASVNEFRIYSGAKSDEDILVDTVAGSSKLTTNATLQSIALSATSTDVNVHGARVSNPVEFHLFGQGNASVITIGDFPTNADFGFSIYLPEFYVAAKHPIPAQIGRLRPGLGGWRKHKKSPLRKTPCGGLHFSCDCKRK